MAKLPGRVRAEIDIRKITDYLLNHSHRSGRGKAIFFESFGFKLDDPVALEFALLQHAYDCEILEIVDNDYGTKYVLEGRLWTPDGRLPNVVTVWFIDRDLRFLEPITPKFVTAYPGKEDGLD